MTRIPGHRFLHSPGPTHIPDEVLDAMHRQPLDLADDRLDVIIDDCITGLKRVLRSERAEVAMFAANGHGGWEAAIENLLAPGAAALVPGTGHFSEQWSIQIEALGREVVPIAWREGYPIDPDQIEAALRADSAGKIAAVFVVHTDTAGSVTSDIGAIRSAMDASGHPALLVVDVVASLCAAPFAMDAMGVNAVVGGSQKGLMLPPGLSFLAVDPTARAVISANPGRRFYWNWERRQHPLSYIKFCGTPPEHLLMGMQAALGLIDREGLENVLARHARLAGAVQAAVEGWSAGGDLRFFARDRASRSVSVTTIEVADGIDPEALRRVAREQFQVAVAGGNGGLVGRVFRIGHLGDLNTAMILGCLGGVEAALRVQKIAIGDGGLARAVAWLADTA